MTDAEPLEDDVDVFDAATKQQVAEDDGDWVELPPVGLLSVETADELLRWRPAHLVAVVGARNSGKTTLISEVYERFLRGIFGGFMFTESWSLHGFEQKSYKSRADTGLDVPDTPRTSSNDGLGFFHLAVTTEEHMRRSDILISERAGELYLEARDAPATVSNLLEIVHASTIVFVVDGEAVANDLTRADAFGAVRALIRAFSDSGAIAPVTEIQVVTTKYDLLDGKQFEEAREALAEFEKRLKASFGNRFANLSTWRTAARDPNGKWPAAWGVAELLNSWIKVSLSRQVSEIQLPPLSDMFDRLLLTGR